MPFNLGAPEVIIVLIIALLFLGPKRLPEVGRSLGRGIREFKDGVTGKDDEPQQHPAATIPPPPPATYTPPAAEQTPRTNE